MNRIRSACSCCFKGSSNEATPVEEKDVESQRSEEDGDRTEVASACQDAPLPDNPTQHSVSNMFRSFFRVSTGSKLALKLYGSRQAVVEEQNRQRHGKHWVIHPISTFRQGGQCMQPGVRLFWLHHYADVMHLICAGGTGTW